MPRAVNLLAGLTGLGLGVTVALAVSAESWSGLQAPGDWLTAAGRLTGLVVTYAMLIVVLLAGRIPVVERTLGQDRLTRWHRKLAPRSLVLIAAHGALITAGYAQSARTPPEPTSAATTSVTPAPARPPPRPSPPRCAGRIWLWRTPSPPDCSRRAAQAWRRCSGPAMRRSSSPPTAGGSRRTASRLAG